MSNKRVRQCSPIVSYTAVHHSGRCQAPTSKMRGTVVEPSRPACRAAAIPESRSGLLTDHARTRCQQRGLPSGILDLLYEFGAEEHDKHGAVILFFDKRARRQMERRLGPRYVQRLEPFLDAYIIEVEGRIVTVGHRYHRITRH